MINPGINSRVLLLAIAPATIIALLLTAYSSANSLRELDEGMKERGRIIAIQLAAASEYGTIAGNTPILQNLVQQTMTQQDDILSVTVTDNRGHVLAVSGKPVLPENVSSHGASETPKEWQNADSLLFSAPVMRSLVEIDDFASPAPSQGNPDRIIGQVYVAIGTTELLQMKNRLIGHTLLIALAGLMISGFIGWRLGQSIVHPVRRLAKAAERLAEGELDIRVPEISNAELRTLECGFNTMAAQLKLAHDCMQDRIDEATEQLSYQAHHDPLTGLVNRREFENRLGRALQHTYDDGTQHVFCYMDLDQFKIVNDTCGHPAGDALLRQLSMILSGRTRGRDVLGRLGGDEFGLLLENCTIEDARQITEELLEMVREFRFVHENKIFSVGMSIGMVAITPETESVESIMIAADTACFAAKDNGRNRIHVFEHGDDDIARRHGEMQWTSRIIQALEDDRFRLYCQPILALPPYADKTCYYEILLRKVSPQGKLVPPMAFIPAAERFHMMGAIDRWVIRNAFASYRTLLEGSNSDRDIVFTINLSAVSLSDNSLLDYIADQFALNGVPPTSICFEITETAAIINLASTIKLINTLKASGCRFMLDDFGSGMSSFAYLKNLPVDFVKIDGTFVKDIASNPIDLAMVQSIHSIARAMQIKTIAEFVEDATTAEILGEIGVHYGQGFHLGRPLPIEHVVDHQSVLPGMDTLPPA